MIKNYISRQNNFRYLSGLPITNVTYNMASLHFAYAALKLNNKKLFEQYIDRAISFTPDDDPDKDYLMAVKQWITFKNNGIDRKKALKVIEKFYFANTVKRLKKNIENDSLLDEFVIECKDCSTCKHKSECSYEEIKKMMQNAGKEYSKFTNGQDKKEFLYT